MIRQLLAPEILSLGLHVCYEHFICQKRAIHLGRPTQRCLEDTLFLIHRHALEPWCSGWMWVCILSTVCSELILKPINGLLSFLVVCFFVQENSRMRKRKRKRLNWNGRPFAICISLWLNPLSSLPPPHPRCAPLWWQQVTCKVKANVNIRVTCYLCITPFAKQAVLYF